MNEELIGWLKDLLIDCLIDWTTDLMTGNWLYRLLVDRVVVWQLLEVLILRLVEYAFGWSIYYALNGFVPVNNNQICFTDYLVDELRD